MKTKDKNKGFTLVELLVVLAIIGILAALGIQALLRAQRASRDTNRATQVEALRNSFSEYYTRHNIVPTGIFSDSACQNPVGTGPSTSETIYVGETGNAQRCTQLTLQDGYTIAVGSKCDGFRSSGTVIRYYMTTDALVYCNEANGEQPIPFKEK